MSNQSAVLDIQSCVSYIDNEDNIKGLFAKLSISRPQYSVKMKKLCSGNILVYLDQELFTNMYNHCLSEQVPLDFSNQIRFVDYKGNRIKDMPKNRNNNYMPDLQRGQISGIPKRLSEIIVPLKQEDNEDLVIIPIPRNYKTLGLMSQNKKMNLLQELTELKSKFAESDVWLLVDELKLQEFQTILSTDYKETMKLFKHVESVSQDMSLCIVECLFGRDFHDTKPADDYVEILFEKSSYIHNVKAIDSKSHDTVMANVRNNNQGIRISITKYPVQNIQLFIQGDISFISLSQPFNVKQGLIKSDNTLYTQFQLQDNKILLLLLNLYNKVKEQELISEAVIKNNNVKLDSLDNIFLYTQQYSQLIADLSPAQHDECLKLYTIMFLDYSNNLQRFQNVIKEHLLKNINKILYSDNQLELQKLQIPIKSNLLMNVKSCTL